MFASRRKRLYYNQVFIASSGLFQNISQIPNRYNKSTPFPSTCTLLSPSVKSVADFSIKPSHTTLQIFKYTKNDLWQILKTVLEANCFVT